MSERRGKRIKTALLCMSHFQSLVGVVIGLTGLYVWTKYRRWSLFFSPSLDMPLLVVFVLATGALLVLSGFLASWVSSRDSTCLQGLFIYVLVVVFCLGSTASALALHNSYYLESEVHPLSGMFQNYTGSSQDPRSRAVDALQESMECCGVHNYTDWWDTSWFIDTGGHMPLSCCNTTFAPCHGPVLLPVQINNVGCQDKLQKVFHFFLLSIVQMFALVFIVQVVLVVITVQLMRMPSPYVYQFL